MRYSQILHRFRSNIYNVLYIFIIINVISHPKFCQAQYFVIKGNEAIYKNNSFKLQPTGFNDSEILVDPVTGKEIKKVFELSHPVKMNGEKIYNSAEVYSSKERKTIDHLLEEYIINSLCKESRLKGLKDGQINIDLNDLIIDKRGKIVYYDYFYAHFTGGDAFIQPLDLASYIDALLSNAPIVPSAKINDKNVVVRLNVSMSKYIFEVRSHIIKCIDKK